MAEAKSLEELDKLLLDAASYRTASTVTRRRWQRTADARRKELRKEK